LFGKPLGLVVQMLIANRFGASAVTDAYLVACVVPNILVASLGFLFATAVVPVLTGSLVSEDPKEGWNLMSTVINICFLLLLLMALVYAVGAPLLVLLLAPGFGDEMRDLTVTLTRILSISILLGGLTGLVTSIMNSQHRFVLPAMAAVVPTAVVMVILLTVPEEWGIASVVFGLSIGSVLAFSVILMSLFRTGYRHRLVLDLTHPGVHGFGYMLIPALGLSVMNQSSTLIDRMMGTWLPEGSISALSFALVLWSLPMLFANSLRDVLFPVMSEQVAQRDTSRLLATLSSGIRICALVTIPATVGLIVLGESLIRLLFQRGAFDQRATWMTATALSFYALGLFSAGTDAMLARAFHSLRYMRTRTLIVAGGFGAHIILNLVLIPFWAHAGIALSMTLSFTLNMLVGYVVLRRKIGKPDERGLVTSLAKVLLSSLGMGITLRLLIGGPARAIGFLSLPYQVLVLGGMMLAGVTVYLLALLVLQCQELSVATSSLRVFRNSVWRGSQQREQLHETTDKEALCEEWPKAHLTD